MQTITINAYTKLYKLQKSEYTVDIATCKEPKETLSSFYNRQTKKPDILINGGLFVMKSGKPIANFMDEKVKLAINSNYLYGMGVTSKGEMMTGSINSAYFKDFVSGYPVLVSNGKAENITFAKELDGKHPRTVIGHNSTHYFILIVDGRTSTNKGATFSEMQKWLVKYGVTFAVNLDGGGSTRCMIGGKVANQPTENRAVDNVICFYKKESSSAGGDNDMAQQYTVTASALNIRKGAGTSYAILGTYKKGDVVTVSQVTNGWGKTDKGYVSMQYLSLVSEATTYDNLTERNLKTLSETHPEVQAAAKKVLEQAGAAGLNVLVTQGFRTKEEQDALYAQGRTTSGSIVTNAQYPKSPHCWGVAFDFCRNVKGKEYDDTDGFFAAVGKIGKANGFTWGGDWTSFVDKPHLELTKFMPNSSTNTLISTYSTPDKFIETWYQQTTIEWYAEAQSWAKENGITDGTRPEDAATRAEVWQMIKNYHEKVK